MPEQQDACQGYRPIADYAIIGDCHTIALVARNGAIDWYCPTRFDAPAIFCRLLDAEKGGYFSVAPSDAPAGVTRRYRGDTNVLETTFQTHAGRIRLTDLMPVFRRQAQRQGYDVGTSRRILRLVEALDGDAEVTVRCKPTFDYARAGAGDVSIVAGQGAIVQGDSLFLAFACPGVALKVTDAGVIEGRLRLRAGERRWLSLTDANDSGAAQAALSIHEADKQLADTLDYWERWTAECSYRGSYRAAVMRSALTLKLLTYEPTGAVVAAPTASLPEVLGGVRNWDYRFSWLRDSALILYAMMTAGYQEEAADFFDWLCTAEHADPNPARQIVYTIRGSRELSEHELPHLAGYCHSQPVRVGNGAASQRQLDIYGEVLTAANLHFRASYRCNDGGDEVPGDRLMTRETWEVLQTLVEQAAQHWQDPDSGIWEVRGGPQQFVYSRLMCWAALDRGVKLVKHYDLPGPADRWASVREDVRQAILTRGYDEQRGAFTQAFGSSVLDASALMIPKVGFLSPTDPRVRSTVDRIRTELTHNGLVYRYRAEDGLPGNEGTFTLCTLWLVDALALSGRLDEARAHFEKVLSYANDVGLLSEEIEAQTGRFLGNFPQGFTHMGLVGSAMNLAKAARHGAEQEPEDEAERSGRARRASR